MAEKKDYLEIMRTGGELTFRQELAMTVQLSVPAILAQISTVVMEYIDSSMVPGDHLPQKAQKIYIIC